MIGLAAAVCLFILWRERTCAQGGWVHRAGTAQDIHTLAPFLHGEEKKRKKKMNKHLTLDGNIPNKIPFNQLPGSKPQTSLWLMMLSYWNMWRHLFEPKQIQVDLCVESLNHYNAMHSPTTKNMGQAAFQLLCHQGRDHRKDRNSCCPHGFTKNRDKGKINWFEWKMSSACFCEEKQKKRLLKHAKDIGHMYRSETKMWLKRVVTPRRETSGPKGGLGINKKKA